MFRNKSNVLDQGGKPATGLGAVYYDSGFGPSQSPGTWQHSPGSVAEPTRIHNPAVSMGQGARWVRRGAYTAPARMPKVDTYKPSYYTDSSVRRLTTITPTSIALTMGTLEAREAFETFGLETEREAGLNVIRAASKEALVYGRMDNLNQALNRHAARIRKLVSEYNGIADWLGMATGQPVQKLNAERIITSAYGAAMSYVMMSNPYGWVVMAFMAVGKILIGLFQKKKEKKQLEEKIRRLNELTDLIANELTAFEVYKKDLERLDKSIKAGLPDVSIKLKKETAVYRPGGKQRLFIDPTGKAPARRTEWVDAPKLAVGTQQLFIKGVEAPVFVKKEAPRKVSDIKPLTTKIAVYGGILGACPRDRWGN